MSDEKTAHEWDWWLVAQTVGALVVVVWFVVGWMLPAGLLGNPTEPNALGDSFGMVNALFSGLAFAGLLVTLMMQRAELRLQREELQMQRLELVESREVMREQARQLAKQREQFERQVSVAESANALARESIDIQTKQTAVIVKSNEIADRAAKATALAAIVSFAEMQIKQLTLEKSMKKSPLHAEREARKSVMDGLSKAIAHLGKIVSTSD